MKIKTMAGWHEFAEKNQEGSWDKYCKPGDLVDSGVYYYFLEVIPPFSMHRGYLQIGEPSGTAFNPVSGKWQNTYITFLKVGKGIWQYLGKCFPGEKQDASCFPPVKKDIRNDISNTKKAIVVRTAIEWQRTWEELATQIRSGNSPAVGDKIDFQMKTGEEVTVVVTQSTEEYVRFESVDCVGGEDVSWSYTGNTKCGIVGSDVMKYLNEKIWGQLPEDLQAVIGSIKRKHKDHEGNVQEYEFRLFLPAASEVFEEGACYGDVGLYEQLDYYKDCRHRMRGASKGNGTEAYWLASVRFGYSTFACYVGSNGNSYEWNVLGAFRVPICFIIKKM